MDQIIDRVFKRLLRENRRLTEAHDEKLGFYTYKKGNMVYGVSFDTELVRRRTRNLAGHRRVELSLIGDFLKESVVAMIAIAPAKGPCNGAWEVKLSAGPGRGKLVYSMGYYLSPNGALISDRQSLSLPAQGAWKKASKKGKGKPLDDITDPKTADPSDDCAVWTIDSLGPGQGYPADEDAVDAVNQSYEAGTGGYDFDAMTEEAERLFADVKLGNRAYTDMLMNKAASKFFGDNYSTVGYVIDVVY